MKPGTALIVGTLATLAGCAPVPPSEHGQPVPPSTAPVPVACNASRVEAFVGRDAHASADEARAAAGARSVRIYGPNQAVTMDFRADRLNLETDAGGRISTVKCG